MSKIALERIAKEKIEKTGRLNLGEQELTEIPKEILELDHLTLLNLSSNQISDYSFLEKMTNLTSLYLGFNQISDISFLEKLTNLTSLNLSLNQISDSLFLEKLTNLTSLNLSFNQISDIKPLLHLIKLGEMNISLKNHRSQNQVTLYNNQIENPPIEIVKQGNAAIVKYFEELESQETIELYEAKMLIIGGGSVGKTSLLRKFISKENKLPEEEETTKGIDIQEYHFQTAANKDFRINK